MRRTKSLKGGNLREIDAVVLCGGEGKRLKAVVPDKPKALAEIGGKPFLEILLEDLFLWGFSRAILSVGHLKDQIIAHLKNCRFSAFQLPEIVFSEENYPLGTGGAVKKTEPLIKSNHFLVINGDVLTDVNFSDFYGVHLEKDSLLSMLLSRVDDASDCGSVRLNEFGRIVSFNEKAPGSNCLVNAGIYFMKKDIFYHLPEEESFSLERDLFPNILTDNYCYGFESGGFVDIGTPKGYQMANKLFPESGKFSKLR